MKRNRVEWGTERRPMGLDNCLFVLFFSSPKWQGHQSTVWDSCHFCFFVVRIFVGLEMAVELDFGRGLSVAAAWQNRTYNIHRLY
jgi:hypothetical protein